jgi:hypothetical protein
MSTPLRARLAALEGIAKARTDVGGVRFFDALIETPREAAAALPTGTFMLMPRKLDPATWEALVGPAQERLSRITAETVIGWPFG